MHDITKRARKIGKSTMKKIDKMIQSPIGKNNDSYNDIYTSKHVFLALRVADHWIRFSKIRKRRATEANEDMMDGGSRERGYDYQTPQNR